MSQENFVFLEDDNEDFDSSSVEQRSELNLGKILTVDDDKSYQQSLLYALNDLAVMGQKVQIVTANSGAEAASILSRDKDISIILLDVVMEEDDSGLRLVETVRNVQGNSLVRIILLTGQPGVAPRKEVLAKYDINEYWNKSDIDHDTLRAVVTANLRSWQSMHELEQARLGLQMVVDASRQLASIYDRDVFIQLVLCEIGKIIGSGEPVSICLAERNSGGDSEYNNDIRVVACVDDIDGCIAGQQLPHSLRSRFNSLLGKSIETKNHQFEKNLSVLYLSTDVENHLAILVLVETHVHLNRYHMYLLQVLSENISSGFMQISLVNKLSKLAYRDSELPIYNQNWLLRELDSMNEVDAKQSELIMFKIDNYDSHVLSYSEAVLFEALSKLYQLIDDRLGDKLNIARIAKDCFAVIALKSSDIQNSTIIGLCDEILDVNKLTIRLAMTSARIDLQLVRNMSPLQALHLSKSMLYNAQQKDQKLIIYKPEYSEKLLYDYKMVADLRQAIIDDEFCVALQPKVELASGKAVGFEALIRWRKGKSFISPGEFIPLAEQTDLITELDMKVIDLTVDAIQKLQNAGYALPVSFNATVKDLQNSQYINLLLTDVENGLVYPDMLELEVTETQAMASYDDVGPILNRLHDLGIKVSIDDFGTGYSSLSHISHLSADTIKIDITFVRHIETDKASQQVVDLVISLAEQLEFSIVAEGIENEAQRLELMSRGCKYGQGFLFGKPMLVEDLILWLGENQKK
ncbi:EAL domain-containing protein [Vibrio sp.]|nr:EAL domain-containing protein [Vibrio sp.]